MYIAVGSIAKLKKKKKKKKIENDVEISQPMEKKKGIKEPIQEISYEIHKIEYSFLFMYSPWMTQCIAH